MHTDFHCIEVCLGLPEFRVIHQVMRPQQLDLHLERRESSIVCPRCQTCCSRVQESRRRCLRDLPILERPVMLWLHLRRFACPACRHRPWETSDTCGARVQWTERLYNQVREECLRRCPGKELGEDTCCQLDTGSSRAKEYKPISGLPIRIPGEAPRPDLAGLPDYAWSLHPFSASDV